MNDKSTKQSKVTKRAKSTGKKNAEQKPPGLFPVVAIGASAGGLEAISELLEHLPKDLGMAYVIIQHLAPNHTSILPELLEKKTSMPVNKVEDNMHVKPNEIYVIPPNAYMSIVDSKLKLMPRTKSGSTYHAIDFFFTALAPVYKSNAIGIILSGTANDGTEGVKEIKAEGGITFAQDESAKYQGMPQSAADAGYVDFILSPKEIARELASISKHPFGLAPEKSLPENEDEIRRILIILNTRQGVDFSCYKKSTVYRRIVRRMVLNKLKTLKEYTQLLRENEKEIGLLYKDLLINVTSFFRDPSIYQTVVKRLLPEIIKGRKATDAIRIWVPGCATGEEACTIAISFIEFFNEKGINMPLQIFATDLNSAAIEQARAGIYAKSALISLSADRIERFFVRNNGSYQVTKQLRDVCVFAPHNLLKDPPFSRMDIVSCHNVLIYLEPESQKKVLQKFHYALKPTGYLLLGKSETAGSAGDIFNVVDKENKIYSKKAVNRLINFDFSSRASFLENLPPENEMLPETDMPDIEKEADRVLLTEYVPASVLINTDLNIIGFRGNTTPYLQPAMGKASFHLLKMVRDDLVFELKALLDRAKQEGRRVKKENISFQVDDRYEEVNIEVIPLRAKGNETYYLTIFKGDPSTVESTLVRKPVKGEEENANSRRLALLEQQLKDARNHIKSISEECESTREELQSSNEEVLSSNEELQSMNEELETSQEELQSINEELTTINDELQHRNIELKEATEYNDAIIRTIREPLIILNENLRVNTANKSYYKFFGGTPMETEGRLFYEISDGQWNEADLRRLLLDINTESKSVNDYKIEKVFPSLGARAMILNANQMSIEGKRSKILIAIEDITTRRDIDKQKDDFIGVAAHELKTPVTTIKVYAELLKEELAHGNEKHRKLTESLNEQVDRLIKLIHDLLDLTRTTKGVLEYEEAGFDVNELINETVEQMQPLTAKHKITKKLKPVEEIWGDRSRIQQVVINIISNAIKYSPEASEIIIHTEAHGDHIEVRIQDFGMGISNDMQERIFERFFRTNSGTFPGIGLGLYISREIVKRHGGIIGVRSILGEGAEFYFILPVGNKNT